MIAAVRRRIASAPGRAAERAAKWSRRADRSANRGLERAYPPLLGAWQRLRGAAKRLAAIAGPRLRPAVAFVFRGLAIGDRLTRSWLRAAVRGATAASEVLTPRRGIALVMIAAGVCLVASQFVDYRAVEIGQARYAELPGGAEPPKRDQKTAGEAHAYLLVPLGLLAVAVGVLAWRRERRRLGLPAVALGAISLATILLVDLPNGLDAGAQTSRFAGARAVLEDGFYAELAAAAGLVLAGLLYYARPCRIRINSSGRAASARRRRPRRQASSRARVARRA
jgi:hypothetical protein